MSASPASRSHVLTHLDVYDWGAFGGRHSAPFDLAGTAIIGPTGSGKTTLVDALMTLLVASPRYNLASTGGHESDRDLVSYVRGVAGAGNQDNDNAHIARPGAVVTAIAARFSDGESVLRIGGLFWFNGSSSAVADLTRRWLFCTSDAATLDDWLEAHREGGARALKDLERRSAGVKVYESKQAFLSRLRDHFDVAENAFTLLNRAAGLKQLNSIDSVFRELVLDDRSAFDDARGVVDQFETLTATHQELETAKQQQEALMPIDTGWKELERQRAELAELAELKRILPVWFAREALARWRARRDELQATRDIRQSEEQEHAACIEHARRAATAAHAAYLQAGGASIESLRDQIRKQESLVASRKRAADQYQSIAGALSMDATLAQSMLAANQDAIAEIRPALEKEFSDLRQTAFEHGAKRAELTERSKTSTHELEEIRKRPGSNIRLQQQQFRHALALHLGLRDDDLPFVAELVQVKAEELRWRGAIERAIGGERLRLLVDADHVKAALAWINARDNKLHVRVHEAETDAAAARFLDDGFTRKLEFKPHALREALKRLLAGSDRHCVDSASELRDVPHAMTAEGLMSGRKGYFDKDDQRPLSEGWMTGFDNRDQIAALEAALVRMQGDLKAVQELEGKARYAADATEKSLRLLDAIKLTVFEDIDLPGAHKELERLEDDLARISAPQSDAAQAQQRWKRADEDVKELQNEAIRIRANLQTLSDQLSAIDSRLDRLAQRVGTGLDARGEELVQQFASVETIALDDLDDIERRRDDKLQSDLASVTARCNALERRLIAAMKDAKAVDTGDLAETGCELDDIPEYLRRLRVLIEEALPEKKRRFREYLNQSSDQGVTQLLSQIDNEVSAIEERIADLNATLERVDFQPGRFLRLSPQRVEHESLRTLRRTRAQLRSAQLNVDDGESEYRALSALVNLLLDHVEKRKTQAALALLDPRYRLQFSVLVIERDGGKLLHKSTSSQGGSGGEKEIFASYVLTASLSYALWPAGSPRPLFATIVLDEAFSKSSQAVAGRIIRALAEFGLHPVFVTPNKELRLLRDHTRSAIVVHRKGKQATLTSLSWEALEAHARHRIGKSGRDDEVA